MDMLQQKPWQADCVVRLLQPVRCPAKHMKVIRAQAVGNDGRSLFQPVKHLIQQHGLQMSEAVVEPDLDGRVMLVVENHGPRPVDLE